MQFCRDQHGSRFIQQKLEVSSEEDKEAFFDEILPHTQRCGIQKLLLCVCVCVVFVVVVVVDVSSMFLYRYTRTTLSCTHAVVCDRPVSAVVILILSCSRVKVSSVFFVSLIW